MKKIIEKTYYKLTFKLASPLSLGGSDSFETDKDLLKDKNGKPFIPASSIAGVLRDKLSEQYDNKALNQYLGYVSIHGLERQSKSIESAIAFYDAEIKDKFNVSKRDNVALNKWKTAIKGAKFDYEILEPGCTFETFVVQNKFDNDDLDIAYDIASLFANNQIAFGGKTMRGLGEIECISVERKAFDLTNTESIYAYVDFDMMEYQYWEKVAIKEENGKSIKLSLKLSGAISIRKYTTNVSENDLNPDFEQMCFADGNPVIPGTSWNGAIRHRMVELGTSVEEMNSIFGFVDGEIKKSKSRICISETILTGSKPKIMSHTAIDRFTSSVKKNALFTEKCFYGGEGELKISFKKGTRLTDSFCKSLAITIADLSQGLLQVGGMTNIGRGQFEITRINEKEVSSPSVVYSSIYELLKEVSVC